MKDDDFLQGLPEDFDELFTQEDDQDYSEEDSFDDETDVYEWEG